VEEVFRLRLRRPVFRWVGTRERNGGLARCFRFSLTETLTYRNTETPLLRASVAAALPGVSVFRFRSPLCGRCFGKIKEKGMVAWRGAFAFFLLKH
jgi:hypothetical protein